MASDKRVKVTLACEECKRRNYITVKNKTNDRERIEMKKYCRFDRSTPSTRRPGNRGARVADVAVRAYPRVTLARLAESDDGYRARRRSRHADLGPSDRRPGGRPDGVRRAGAPDLRRHLHAGGAAHRQRGGRTGRGAGGLSPGLEGHRAVPRRRAVLDVDVPDHREQRGHARQRAPAPSRTEPLDDVADPVETEAGAAARGRGRERRADRPSVAAALDELPAASCGRSWC